MDRAQVHDRLIGILRVIFRDNNAQMPQDNDDSIRTRLDDAGLPEPLVDEIMSEVFDALAIDNPDLDIPPDQRRGLETVNAILDFLELDGRITRSSPSPRGIVSSSTPLESARVHDRLIGILRVIFRDNNAQMPQANDSIRNALRKVGISEGQVDEIMSEVFDALAIDNPDLDIPPDQRRRLETVNAIVDFLERRNSLVVGFTATRRAAGRSLAASTEVSDALEPELQGSLGKYLHEYGLDWMLGNWQGQDNACQMSIRLHPSGTSAEIFWKSTFGETSGVIVAGKPTRPKKPKTRRKTERMLASGDLVTESGKQQTYRLVVEFAFDAHGTQIMSRRLWIRPKSKAGLPEYTLASFPDVPNNGPTLFRFSDSGEEILCAGMQRMAEA